MEAQSVAHCVDLFSSGIYKIDDEEYFALPHISKSGLDMVAKSPSHFKYWSEREKQKTKAMDLGSAVHAAVLEPEVFKARYTCAPDCDRRTKVGKAQFAEWQLENGGKIPLSSQDWSSVLGAATAVFSHPQAQPLLMGGEPEMALVWETPHDGPDGRKLLAKGKVDYLNHRTIVDLKTSRDASREAFQESIKTYRYHVQAAFYSDGLEYLNEGMPVEDFVFIVVEPFPPYHVAVYRPDDSMVIEGRRAYERDLRLYADCMRTGQWPGMNKDLASYISLPRRG